MRPRPLLTQVQKIEKEKIETHTRLRLQSNDSILKVGDNRKDGRPRRRGEEMIELTESNDTKWLISKAINEFDNRQKDMRSENGN